MYELDFIRVIRDSEVSIGQVSTHLSPNKLHLGGRSENLLLTIEF